MPVLLSLFDHSGNWSMPFFKGGWDVIIIDKQNKDSDNFCIFDCDINDLDADFFYENIFDNFGTVDGILCAPPCTAFSSSGAHTWQNRDQPKKDLFGEFNEMDIYINLVKQCLRVINLCCPAFWALENPVGRINKLVPEIGKPWFFQPYEFGDPWSKKTGIYGNFNKPPKTNIVRPSYSLAHKKGGGKGLKSKNIRSITPMGFAQAFYEANKNLSEQYLSDDFE